MLSRPFCQKESPTCNNIIKGDYLEAKTGRHHATAFQPKQRENSVAKAKGRWGQRPKEDRHYEGAEAIHKSKKLLRQRKRKEQQNHNVDFNQDS